MAYQDFHIIKDTLQPLLAIHCHLPSALSAQQGSISQHQIYPTIHVLSVSAPFSTFQSDHEVLPLFLTIKFSLLKHWWETALLWHQVTAGASGCSHWCLLHMLMWIREGLNCKCRGKCPETNGLALPPSLTLSEPGKLLPSLFSAPRAACSMFLRLALGLSRLLKCNKVTVTKQRYLSQERIYGPRAYVCGEFTVWA